MKSSVATERARQRRALIERVNRIAPALLFGSCALELAHPTLLTHEPPDVDFLVPLTSVAPIVESIDHTWTSWDEPFDPARLVGRFYVRGRHPSRPTLDLTYESPVEWDVAWARRVVCEGIAVASAHDIATVYRARAREGDAELARRIESEAQKQ